MADSRPIGIFDSGVGGLTVCKAISKHLPQESILYFGDTKHLPYGDKSQDTIGYYSLRICKYLLKQDCKMLVVACNSASTAAYDVMLDFFGESTLFVDVVDPLVHEIAQSNCKRVGVIATKATTNSHVYKSKIEELDLGIEVIEKATPLLVPMIETGFHKGKVSQVIIDEYLTELSRQTIDGIVLACTHYPLIRDEIDRFFDGKIKIFDSTDVVALAVKEKLEMQGLLSTDLVGSQEFQVSDLTESFQETAKIFYSNSIDLKEKDIWDR